MNAKDQLRLALTIPTKPRCANTSLSCAATFSANGGEAFALAGGERPRGVFSINHPIDKRFKFFAAKRDPLPAASRTPVILAEAMIECSHHAGGNRQGNLRRADRVDHNPRWPFDPRKLRVTEPMRLQPGNPRCMR